MKFQRFTIVFFLLFVCSINLISAQNVGDTIKVQAFNFESTTRDTLISFPNDQDLTYEKILLKYTMRCKDGLVSNSSDRNKGCGEWDYSCNTYLVDSSKIEEVLSVIPSHNITNFTESNFAYMETPVYDYYIGSQTSVTVNSVSNHVVADLGNGTLANSNTFKTDNKAGKSQYLFLASELTAAGLVAGKIDALSIAVLAKGGQANYLKIKLDSTESTEVTGPVLLDETTLVYYKNTGFTANQDQRFNLAKSFTWNGTSNLLVEFSFSNIDADLLTSSQVESENTTNSLGIYSKNEQHLLLSNQTYIECETYKGITGSQNRTVEAWIKTSATTDAEICSWGSNIASEKWVFRLNNNGQLRVENAAGGTVSSKTVNDGKWHHVAAVLDGNNLKDIRFYVDGVLSGNSSVGNTAITTTEGYLVRISRGVNDRYLEAEIDQVRIWDTNLPAAILKTWSQLKINDTHPYFANLQLSFDFDESGKNILDNSGNERNAIIIGQEYRCSFTDGANLFKDFNLSQNRPNVSFYQGDYNITKVDSAIMRPVEKSTKYFLISRSIESTSSNEAKDDIINNTAPIECWLPIENTYDEQTGELLSSKNLTADKEINISNLEYYKRYPFYNELVSFVTPYGIGIDFGMEGKSWYFDMSDYVHVLKGDKRLLMTLGGQWQEEMNLEFQFIVGTPPRNVVQYDQIWQGTNRIGAASIQDILANNKLAPKDIDLNANASSFKIKSSITGHGSEGEFHQNGGIITHKLLIDHTEKLSWPITQECSKNPIYPQGGTWVYDRQGWCPGERSLLKEEDVTSLVNAGSTVNFDYNTSNPSNPNGAYKYHVTHQLVAYGAPNHQIDAAVVDVIAPNNTALYTRVGTICANPSIIIQNTGATTLTSLDINYWINESQASQNYHWTGSLEFMEKEEIILPNSRELWFDILELNNKFSVEISSPNQAEDEYTFNNHFTSEFNVPEVLPQKFTLEFRTNNRPYENNYELIDEMGNVVGSNNLTLASTTYKDTFNLSGGCYKLIVNDAGGDGVQWWANTAQGTGYIRIKNETGSIIKIFEPDFGAGFEYSFSIDIPISVEELNFLTSIKVYPNPVSDVCIIEAENVENAELYLTSLSGQLVNFSINNRDNESISLDIENLDAGIYLVVVRMNGMQTTRKIIKE